jgi:hypothetical protein
MTVPALPLSGGTLRDVSPTTITSPYTGTWWLSNYIVGVPESALGWLVAQGWQVANAATDEDGVTTYALSRQSMNSWMILQSLLNQFVSAYNEGRAANSIRYNDVIDLWTNLLNVTRSTLNTHADVSDGHVTVYLGYLDDLQTEVDTQVAAIEADMSVASSQVAVQLASYLSRLVTLESQYDTHATTMTALINQFASELSTFLASYSASVDRLESALTVHQAAADAIKTEGTAALTAHEVDYGALILATQSDYTAHAATVDVLLSELTAQLGSHVTAIDALLASSLNDYSTLDNEVNALLDTLDTEFGEYSVDANALLGYVLSDYGTHSSLASGYLTGLGTVDTARINEQFDNLKSRSMQGLMDRGLYSSSLFVPIDTRIERERSEALSKLADQLNREKLDNQHKLYAQQLDVRIRTLDGKTRVFSLQQDVIRYRAETLTRLHGQLQEVRNRTVAAKGQLLELRRQVAQFNTATRDSLLAQKLNVDKLALDASDRLYQYGETLRKLRLGDEHQMFSELAAVYGRDIEAVVKSYEAQRAVLTAIATQREHLLAQFLESRGRALGAQEKYNAMSLQNGQFLSETRQRMIATTMQARLARASGRMDVRDKEEKIMAYQLDTRNNLAVGLFGFVERREDSYPDMSEITKLVAGLGDSGGGWVTP